MKHVFDLSSLLFAVRQTTNITISKSGAKLKQYLLIKKIFNFFFSLHQKNNFYVIRFNFSPIFHTSAS